MGDSSKCISSAHDSHLQKCDSFKFIDDGDSFGEDSAPTYEWQEANTSKKSIGVSNPVINGSLSSAYDLDKPVPLNTGEDVLGAEGTSYEVNGHDDFATEPIISPSMKLGKEANGFDEAAQIEGSEEEVETSSASPTNDSDNNSNESWCQEDISENESSEPETSRKPDLERIQSYHNIISTSCRSSKANELKYERLGNEDVTYKPHGNVVNGQSNIHKSLYSSTNRSDDLVGYGENSACYNHSSNRPGNNNSYYADTFKPNIVTPNNPREPYKPTFQSTYPVRSRNCPLSGSYGLSSAGAGFPVAASSGPLPSTHSPSVSSSNSSRSFRQALPYESKLGYSVNETKTPPFGCKVNESLLRKGAVGLITPPTESPKGMPKAEWIAMDDAESTATATSGNDIETAKKKKKKKKKSTGGLKGDSSDVPDKNSGYSNSTNAISQMLTSGNETSAQQDNPSPVAYYPPSAENGSSVMPNGHRTKAGRGKSGKSKKKSENVIKAREIEGNRGGDDVDTLVGYVEGKKKSSQSEKNKLAASIPVIQEKTKKKQKVISRTITTDCSFPDYNGEPSVMGRVVEQDASVLTPCVELTPVVVDGEVRSAPNHTNSESAEVEIPPTSPDDLCNDVFVEEASTGLGEPVNEKASDGVLVKDVSVSIKEAYDCAPALKPQESSEVPVSTPTSAELEFTNFEGLIESIEEQPFEKYVGRKKKPRGSVPRQGPQSNSSYNQQRGFRWSASTHQHFNNRVHGNGHNNTAQIPYTHSGQKQYPNQASHRYPSSSNFPPFGSKSGSPSMRPGVHQQGGNGESRKTASCVIPTTRHSAMNTTAASGVSAVSEASSSTSSTNVVTASTLKTPPVKEDFPPLRPTTSGSSIESTLPGRKSTASASTPVSTSSASSSSSPSATILRASHTSPRGETTTPVSSCAASLNGRSSNAVSISTTPSPAGDSETFRANTSCAVATSKSNVYNASVSASPRGDVDKGVPLSKISWNFIQVQQFLELLYPKENEKCNFYSEASKRAHYFNASTTSGFQ